MTSSVGLTKHHALGNDFLVMLDDQGVHEIGPNHARAWCNRRTGIGADGLIVVTTGTQGAEVTMTLYNADGSVAEISGNGIRCLGQAVARDRGLVDLDLTVATGSGFRTLRMRAGEDERTMMASVDMGQACEQQASEHSANEKQPSEQTCEVGDIPTTSGHRKSLSVDMGNPHTVLLYDDIEKRDRVADALRAGASNVELVMVDSAPDTISMRVIERGVGETFACGSGACAAAYAAHQWGVVGTRVTVKMPGGDVTVDLQPNTIVLTGPTVFIGTVLIGTVFIGTAEISCP